MRYHRIVLFRRWDDDVCHRRLSTPCKCLTFATEGYVNMPFSLVFGVCGPCVASVSDASSGEIVSVFQLYTPPPPFHYMQTTCFGNCGEFTRRILYWNPRNNATHHNHRLPLALKPQEPRYTVSSQVTTPTGTPGTTRNSIITG
jgi:hypothetical protein